MTRFTFISLSILVLTFTVTGVALADEANEPTPAIVGPDFLCPAAEQLARPGMCSWLGPGGYAARIRSYELPVDLPAIPVEQPVPEGLPVNHTYARVATDAPVYSHPSEAGKEPLRLIGIGQGVGFLFVSLGELIVYEGEEWYKVNDGEYIRRSDVELVEASGFQGVEVLEQPTRPFAWLVRNYDARLSPGGVINSDADRLFRYDVVHIYATEKVGEWNWYLVGHNKWVEQRNLSIVEVKAPPEGVTGRWIEIDLFEQTMAAYDGERMVYASLISSGLGDWPTNTGLFQVYVKLLEDRMSGAFAADRSDYYYLEDVPWTMYFDGGIALHGAYWHNGFGFRKSHGCVNLAPRDSKWLFDWAEVGTWVRVQDSGENSN